jgi:thiamine-monophosphate kinase
MLGEFDIVREYFTRLPQRPESTLGIGDDAALLCVPEGHELALTTDTLVAGRHFPGWASPQDIGWKSLAVNLSDLAAMGAEPSGFTLALTLPEPDRDWLTRFAQGLFELAQQFNVDLVGGDTTRGPLSITVTAYGLVPAGQALRRNGAKPGDLVCVTGTLGDAALALDLREQAPEPLAVRLHRPVPRVAAGIALRGLASAVIDLSDGLAGDLRHILKASRVGADIQLARLPRSEEFQRMRSRVTRLFPADHTLQYQLAGGDDYELCFCLPPDRLAEAGARVATGFTVVGAITPGSGLRWLDAGGAQAKLALGGYDHFNGSARKAGGQDGKPE